MRDVLAIFGLALLFAGLVASQWDKRRVDPEVVRIATWNLRQFNADRETIDLDGIADIIRQGRFDVVAVQEVQGEPAVFGKLATAIGRQWRFDVSEPTGDGKRFGFLWNARRIRYEGGEFLDVNGVYRTPFVGSFRGGAFNVAIVQVHLRATDLEARLAEAEVIASANLGDGDVVLLGDFNTTRVSENSLSPFEERGWRVLNETPTNLGDSAVLDNILIDPLETTESLGPAGVVFFDEGQDDNKLRRRISDHRPVYADFDATMAND